MHWKSVVMLIMGLTSTVAPIVAQNYPHLGLLMNTIGSVAAAITTYLGADRASSLYGKVKNVS